MDWGESEKPRTRKAMPEGGLRDDRRGSYAAPDRTGIRMPAGRKSGCPPKGVGGAAFRLGNSLGLWNFRWDRGLSGRNANWPENGNDPIFRPAERV